MFVLNIAPRVLDFVYCVLCVLLSHWPLCISFKLLIDCLLNYCHKIVLPSTCSLCIALKLLCVLFQQVSLLPSKYFFSSCSFTDSIFLTLPLVDHCKHWTFCFYVRLPIIDVLTSSFRETCHVFEKLIGILIKPFYLSPKILRFGT